MHIASSSVLVRSGRSSRTRRSARFTASVLTRCSPWWWRERRQRAHGVPQRGALPRHRGGSRSRAVIPGSRARPSSSAVSRARPSSRSRRPLRQPRRPIRKRRRIEATLEEPHPRGRALEGHGAVRGMRLGAREHPRGSGNALLLVSALRPLAVQTASASSWCRTSRTWASATPTRQASRSAIRASSVSASAPPSKAPRRSRHHHASRRRSCGGHGRRHDRRQRRRAGGIAAPTLRQGISRLVAQLVLHCPGLTSRECVRSWARRSTSRSEIGSFPDGRLRVTRIAELGGADAKVSSCGDLFVFNADPSGGVHELQRDRCGAAHRQRPRVTRYEARRSNVQALRTPS